MTMIHLLLFVLCSYLVTALAIIIGLISQCVYWLLFDSFGRRETRAKRQLEHADDLKDGNTMASLSALASRVWAWRSS